MSKVKNILRIIVSVPAFGAGIALIGLMMVTVIDVLLRLIVSKAITGSIELSQIIMICAGYLGIAWCAFNDQHIKVDLLVCKLPVGVQKNLSRFTYVLLVVMTFMIALFCYKSGLDVRMLGSRTQLLRIPQFPFYMIAAFSYLLLSVTGLVLLILTFFKEKKSAEDKSCEIYE